MVSRVGWQAFSASWSILTEPRTCNLLSMSSGVPNELAGLGASLGLFQGKEYSLVVSRFLEELAECLRFSVRTEVFASSSFTCWVFEEDVFDGSGWLPAGACHEFFRDWVREF